MEVTSTLSLTSALDGVVNATPRPLYPTKSDREPTVRGVGRAVGPPARVYKILPQQEYDPRNVQPVACRYTDCALPADTERRRYVPGESKWPIDHPAGNVALRIQDSLPCLTGRC